MTFTVYPDKLFVWLALVDFPILVRTRMKKKNTMKTKHINIKHISHA